MHGSKTCFKCNKTLPLTEFYAHKMMSDGHLNKCKACTKKDVGEHREKNIEKIREYDRNRSRSESTKQLMRESGRVWRNRDSRITMAHTMAKKAIKNGDIKKEPCIVCGNERSMAHHEDYNKPLDVVWYCMIHHKARHKQMAMDGIDPLCRIDEEEMALIEARRFKLHAIPCP